MKCSNGKYKYGEHGDCVYDTLGKCKEAAAAIHINEPSEKSTKDMNYEYGTTKPFPTRRP